jgi:hypothetical protein
MLTEREKTIRQREVRKLMHKQEDVSDPIVREVYMLGPQAKRWFQGLKNSIKTMIE